MVRKLKRRYIDSIDREILRFMYGTKRPVSGHQISKKIKVSPPAIGPHLNKLRDKGIIKPTKIGGMRSFDRTFKGVDRSIAKTIKAPSRIQWDLDLIRKKKRRK